MRIAHLSDLHVLSMEGVSGLRFFNKRFTGLMNLKLKRQHVHRSHTVVALLREIRRQNPEHVVITGDLTNLALEPEFEAVREMLDKELGLDPSRVSVVPGNHDLYTRGALRSQRFTKYLAPYVTSDLPELAADLALGPFPFVRLRENVAIIGLSSAVPRLPLVASGELGQKQTDALRAILANDEVKKRTPVFLLHHPPKNPDSAVKTAIEGLWDAAALMSHSNHLHRGLLLHGHLHRRIHRAHLTPTGSLDSVGATSASLHHEHADRMAGFNTYDIGASGSVDAISSYVFDAEHGTFSVRAVPKVEAA